MKKIVIIICIFIITVLCIFYNSIVWKYVDKGYTIDEARGKFGQIIFIIGLVGYILFTLISKLIVKKHLSLKRKRR